MLVRARRGRCPYCLLPVRGEAQARRCAPPSCSKACALALRALAEGHDPARVSLAWNALPASAREPGGMIEA